MPARTESLVHERGVRGGRKDRGGDGHLRFQHLQVLHRLSACSRRGAETRGSRSRNTVRDATSGALTSKPQLSEIHFSKLGRHLGSLLIRAVETVSLSLISAPESWLLQPPC